MADLVLAIVGVAIAAPRVAVSLAQCGDHLKNLVHKFTNAPETVRKIGVFGIDLHQGKLKVDLELAECIFSADDVDEALKDALEDMLTQLKLALVQAATILNSFFDKKGNVRRAYFTLLGDRKTTQALDALKTWQRDFECLIEIIDKKRRLVSGNLLLSRDRFRVIHKRDGLDLEQISGTNVFLADCEYMDREIQTFRCLIERKEMPPDVPIDEIKSIASILSTKLNTATSNLGILQCLGYREAQGLELVFRMPPNASQVSSLDTIISASTAEVNGGYPLEERTRLCRELCEAVLCVHSAGLVHKNIRPSAILLITPDHKDERSEETGFPGLASPFLMEWFMLRKTTALSSRRGASDWRDAIYRHPRRQGQQPEERYNIGHDIYSLGVVLLEICLWERFIQQSDQPTMGDKFVTRAVKLKIVNVTDSASIEKLTAPWAVQEVMVSLCKTDVAPRFGSAMVSLIEACLTCLEGGLNGLREEQFKASPALVAMKFREMFMKNLPSTNV